MASCYCINNQKNIHTTLFPHRENLTKTFIHHFMSNYNILQLNAKELSELKDIASELGLKVSNSTKKEALVYDILDQQAVVNAQRKTISNENQEIERKKRLRVPIKKTQEQKTAAPQNNAEKVIVDKPAPKNSPKENNETKKVVAKQEPKVAAVEVKHEEATVTPVEENVAKKPNKAKSKKPLKPLIKPADKVEKVEISEVADAEAVPATPIKVFVLEDKDGSIYSDAFYSNTINRQSI